MASATKSVNIDDCIGQFDVDSVIVYNMLNVGRFVVSSFESTFNFCAQLGLVTSKRECCRCRRNLKLSVDRRDNTTTPIVYRCTNKACKKDYYSIREGTVFEGHKLSLEQILVLMNLFCAKITGYEQIHYQGQLSRERLSYEQQPTG